MAADIIVMCDLQRELAHLYLDAFEEDLYFGEPDMYASCGSDGERDPELERVQGLIRINRDRLAKTRSPGLQNKYRLRREYWMAVQNLYLTHDDHGRYTGPVST